jgi:hypothetical protein
MVDFGFGTRLVHLDTRKMKKLSYKDLIVVLGILVAAFIILTTVYFKDGIGQTNSMKAPEKKVKPAAIINTVLQKLTQHTSL